MRTFSLLSVLWVLAACDSAPPPESEPAPASTPCPAAVGLDSTLVLPVAEGMEWTFDLRTSTALTGEPPRRSTGQVELAVTSAGACAGGEQAFTLRERRTETVERRNPDGGAWEVLSGPTTTERTVRWTVTDTAVRTDAPDLQGRPGAGLDPPPFGREAPRSVPTDQLDADGRVRLPPGYRGPYIHLRADVGPVYFGTQTLFGTRGDASEVWELAE